jgi:hypothetical protein
MIGGANDRPKPDHGAALTGVTNGGSDRVVVGAASLTSSAQSQPAQRLVDKRH